MDSKRVLISGGGIAGLTLAIELKRRGFDPHVIEREPAPRSEGYMMDFFGTGWDVAERMGLVDDLRAIRYPIDDLDFVDKSGVPYKHVPIERLRQALTNRYTYLRRPDLERILADRARGAGVTVRYGVSIASLNERHDGVAVSFEDGATGSFALVIGADGVHSRVRELVFGPQAQYARFLGLYVAAFHIPRRGFPIERAVKLYQEPDRMAFFYPLDRDRMDATYVVRHAEIDIPKNERLDFMRRALRGAGWIAEEVIEAYDGSTPIYFDSATQIEMPQWHRGRIALIGDACGCLTLLAGQGSHMAMAGAYVLAQELERQPDYAAAFAAYQAFLKPRVDRKRREATRYANLFVPAQNSWPALRRTVIRLLFSKLLLKYGMVFFGTRSVLAGYP
jgi:2-polyprenyl-6-methoxyphenol hydroxylase-like FAD-dependent oxidoreductase